jgi:hypothetical protein
MSIFSSSTSANTTWNVNAAVVTHTPVALPTTTINYSALESMNVSSGTGNDSISCNSPSVPVTVFPNTGTDVISVNETIASAPVNLWFSPGDDTVNVNTDAVGSAVARFITSQRIGTLNVSTGGTAQLTSASSMVLTATSLNFFGSGRLDLGDEDLIVDYSGASPIASVQSLLQSGYNAGAWNGPGINTSLGNATTLALGYAEASDVAAGGSFSGQAVDSTAVVIKYTFYGDADLNGVVDVADLGRLATNWQQSPRHWAQGNFNYDSIVNVGDLGSLATNWQAGVGSMVAPTSLQKSAGRLAELLIR